MLAGEKRSLGLETDSYRVIAGLQGEVGIVLLLQDAGVSGVRVDRRRGHFHWFWFSLIFGTAFRLGKLALDIGTGPSKCSKSTKLLTIFNLTF